MWINQELSSTACVDEDLHFLSISMTALQYLNTGGKNSVLITEAFLSYVESLTDVSRGRIWGELILGRGIIGTMGRIPWKMEKDTLVACLIRTVGFHIWTLVFPRALKLM